MELCRNGYDSLLQPDIFVQKLGECARTNRPSEHSFLRSLVLYSTLQKSARMGQLEVVNCQEKLQCSKLPDRKALKWGQKRVFGRSRFSGDFKLLSNAKKKAWQAFWLNQAVSIVTLLPKTS